MSEIISWIYWVFLYFEGPSYFGILCSWASITNQSTGLPRDGWSVGAVGVLAPTDLHSISIFITQLPSNSLHAPMVEGLYVLPGDAGLIPAGSFISRFFCYPLPLYHSFPSLLHYLNYHLPSQQNSNIYKP